MQARTVTRQPADSMGQTLARASRLFGNRAAVIDGDCQISYAELADRVARLGGGMLELGARPGDMGAFLGESSLERLKS